MMSEPSRTLMKKQNSVNVNKSNWLESAASRGLLSVPSASSAGSQRARSSAPIIAYSRTGYVPSIIIKVQKQHATGTAAREFSKIDWTEWADEGELEQRRARSLGPPRVHSAQANRCDDDDNKTNADKKEDEELLLRLPKLEDGTRKEQEEELRRRRKSKMTKKIDVERFQGISMTATKYMKGNEAEKQVARNYAAFSEIGIFF